MKQFDLWNKEKIKLEAKAKKIICHRRQIWLCKIGENLGSESSKNQPFIRPVLIINSFMAKDMIFVAPLTTNLNETIRHFLYGLDAKNGLKYQSYVMLNQLKTMSKKRLLIKVASVDNDVFRAVVNKMSGILNPQKHVSD